MSAKQCSRTPISASGGFYRQMLVQAAKKTDHDNITDNLSSSFRNCFHHLFVHSPYQGSLHSVLVCFLHLLHVVTQLLIQGEVVRLPVNPRASFPSSSVTSCVVQSEMACWPIFHSLWGSLRKVLTAKWI